MELRVGIGFPAPEFQQDIVGPGDSTIDLVEDRGGDIPFGRDVAGGGKDSAKNASVHVSASGCIANHSRAPAVTSLSPGTPAGASQHEPDCQISPPATADSTFASPTLPRWA